MVVSDRRPHVPVPGDRQGKNPGSRPDVRARIRKKPGAAQPVPFKARQPPGVDLHGAQVLRAVGVPVGETRPPPFRLQNAHESQRRKMVMVGRRPHASGGRRKGGEAPASSGNPEIFRDGIDIPIIRDAFRKDRT